MQTVQPIRDPKQIEAIKNYLYDWDPKYWMLWILGTNTGLRVSDILKLKVSNVRDTDHVWLNEQKTGKDRRLYFNRQMKKTVSDYIRNQGLSDDDYLIQSQKRRDKPMSREWAYTVLNRAAEACGIDTSKEKIGTHTMRKTFGYWHYQRHHDVALLQKIFNHSAPSITLRYIGVTDDLIDQSLEDFFI